MIPALVAMLSAGGLVLAGALLRPVRSARMLAAEPDEHEDVRFGLDSAGLV